MRRRLVTRHAPRLLLAACLFVSAAIPALATDPPAGETRALGTASSLGAASLPGVIAASEAAGSSDAAGAPAAAAQGANPPNKTTSLEVYGFAMVDFGQNFTSINPNWFDTMRLTRLPTYKEQFGKDGSTFAGVRQTRFGVRTTTPTDIGDLKTIFEWELFGTGVDEGQTTFRLRHAYGEIGQLGAGQYWSPFMDIDVFPNSLEYWGPAGMVFFRNVQVRWMPIQGDKRLTLAVERPGASGDSGLLADRVELQNVKGRSPAPDFSAEYRYGGSKGYVEVAGMLGWLKWDDMLDDQFDLSGSATRWGINLSSNVKFGSKDTLRLQYVFGEGIQNYMNDAPVDVGISVNRGGGAARPIEGEAIPIAGSVVFLDHNWNSKFSTAIGYSGTYIDNLAGQADNAYKTGHYALGNILYNPAPNVMLGGEFQWGRRESFRDDFVADGVKLQFSFKYNFSQTFGGQ